MPPRRVWPRALCLSLLVLLTACKGLPLPRLVFDTPTPAATAGPPPTPLPTTIVTFRVRVPANTPGGTAPAVSLLDLVSGRTTTVVLTQAGTDIWTGGTSAAQGVVLAYKYTRPLPSLVEEVTAGGQPVPYRLLAVNSEKPTVEDTIAGWADASFSGATGAVEGRVWNANTGQGVSGMLVTAAGQTTLTAHDGGFKLFALPAGPQRVTLLAPDGSLRPANQVVEVAPGQTAQVDLISSDPNAVHVTFVIRPPAGADPHAVPRLVGSVWQLGATFAPGVGGSALAVVRAPTLVPLADGRWAASVELYEGTLLQYKYTLGDGYWNGELDASGDPRLRQLLVPATDLLLDETVTAWHKPRAASVTFEALTPANTPANDTLAIQFRTDRWLPPVPMWRVDTHDWRFVLYHPSDFDGSVFYRYCRNLACGTADDSATSGAGASGRFFSPAFLSQNLRDNISGWQWLGTASGTGPTLPPVNPHLNFVAGAALDETWQPNSVPFYSQGFSSLRGAGANWVSLERRGLAVPAGTAHRLTFQDDPALAPLTADWKNIVNTAHTVGLQVALHPITCHYTPYGACGYWEGVDYGGRFWEDWFGAYEYYILTQAVLARDSGTDQLVVGDFKLRPSFPGEPEAPADAEARWRGLIRNVRAVYRGQIAFELLMGDTLWPNPPAFLDEVDVLRVWWWSSLTNTSAANPADLAATAGTLLDTHVLPLQHRFGKPVILNAAYLSADGAATQCLRRPDGACHSFEDFSAGAPAVGTYALDLAEQADAYHGLLLAVNDRPWVGGLLTYGYLPHVTLRDKSLSVRGKPAEAVLSAWWPSLTGR